MRTAFAYWIPNLITILRLLSVPVMVTLMLEEAFSLAFWIFAGAGISDALDGYLARRFCLQTRLGTYLDPLADKALLIAAFLTLWHLGRVANWLVVLVVFRDMIIVGGAMLFQQLTHRLRIQPILISKVNTTVQIAYVVLVLSALAGMLPPQFAGLEPLLVGMVAATTFLSGAAYVITWGRKTQVIETDRLRASSD